MLQLTNRKSQLFAFGEDAITLGMEPAMVAELESILVDRSLQLQAQLNLLVFDNGIRFDTLQELRTLAIAKNPMKASALVGVAQVVAIHTKAAAELSVQLFNKGTVGHIDATVQDIRNTGATLPTPFANSDIALTIEQSSNVTNVKHTNLLRVIAEKLAKSGDTPCPVRKDAEGQSRTKQSFVRTMGVRNEHGPTAKAKMCSELHGNMERWTEMIHPFVSSYIAKSNKLQYQMDQDDFPLAMIFYTGRAVPCGRTGH